MIILKERLRLALDLRPGEGSLVGMLLLHSLLQGIALAYFFTAANALFLERLELHDFDNLAWVYLAAGLLSAACAMAYARLEHRVRFERLLQWSVVVLVPVVLLLRVLLELTDPFVVAFMLLVWYHVMHYLIDSRFWELSAVLFDVRQSRRLFGMVSLGESVAKVIGYLSVPLLVYLAGTENLLLFAAAALMLSLPALRRMLDRYRDRLSGIGGGHGDAHGGEGNASSRHEGESQAADYRVGGHDAVAAQTPRLADRRYFVLLLFFTLFSFSALFFLEFGFLSTVQKRFAGTEIATFLGVFFGAGKALNILARAFLSGRFIRRYGLLVGLALLPVILLVLTIAIIGVPMIASGERLPLLLFGLTVLIAETLRGPLANTAYLILFQPLPPKRRLDAHMLAKAKGEPMAMVAAGAALIVITQLGGTLFAVSIGLALLMLGWIVVSTGLAREYVTVVGDSLRKRVLRGGALELDDPTTTAILESRVRSDDPADVLYALTLLTQAGSEKLEGILVELALHPSPTVRREALSRIDELAIAGAAGALEQIIEGDEDERLRGMAVTVFCVVAGDRAIEVAAPLLEDPSAEVANGAMVGLLRNGGLQGVLTAGARLMAMASSQDPSERARAARAIGAIGNPGFYHPLLPLLADPDRHVSEAALRASGAVGNPALVESLVAALAVARDAEAAAAALIHLGAVALPALERRFDTSDDPRALRRICRIAERIGGDGARAILARGLRHPRRDVRDQAASSMVLGAWTVTLDDPGPALAAIDEELADATLLLMHHEVVLETYGEPARALGSALAYELERLRNRILLLLALAFDRDRVLRARDRVGSSDPALRANAIEILELTLPRAVSERVMPLFEEREPARQLAALTAVTTIDRPEPRAALSSIFVDEEGRHSGWTRACALRVADAHGAVDTTTDLQRLLTSPERVVRETASEIARRIEADARTVGDDDLDDMRRESDDGDINDVQTRATMISTIEKVMTLKRTDMFSETPEEILTDVAEAMQELFVPSGEEIIRKGEPGNCMYIIHEGSVRVHDGDHEFGRFGARDHFGELSLLDPEPRSASVTTLEDSHLLRLDQDALYEIMADSVEVARGILRNLTRRLRAQNALIVKLESGESE